MLSVIKVKVINFGGAGSEGGGSGGGGVKKRAVCFCKSSRHSTGRCYYRGFIFDRNRPICGDSGNTYCALDIECTISFPTGLYRGH